MSKKTETTPEDSKNEPGKITPAPAAPPAIPPPAAPTPAEPAAAAAPAAKPPDGTDYPVIQCARCMSVNTSRLPNSKSGTKPHEFYKRLCHTCKLTFKEPVT